MTPREGVIAAVGHEEPDKVPVDLGGTIVTSLTRNAYVNLRNFPGLAPDPEPHISHFAMDTVRAKNDLSGIYDVDTRPITMNEPFGFAMKGTAGWNYLR